MYYVITIIAIIVFCFFAAYVMFVADQLKAIIDRLDRIEHRLDEHSNELNDMRGWIDKLSYNVFRRRGKGE